MHRFASLIVIIALISAIIITIGTLVACGARKKIDIRVFIETINEIYDDSFTYVASGGQPWSSSYSEIIMSSEKLKGQKVTFQVSDLNSFSDNYIPVKYKQSVEEAVCGIASTVFGQDVVVINVPGKYSAQHYLPETTFEEYCKAQGNLIVCAILANVSLNEFERESAAEALRSGMERMGIRAELRIYLYDRVPTSEINIIDSELFDFSPEAKAFGTIKLNDDFSMRKCEWRNTNG